MIGAAQPLTRPVPLVVLLVGLFVALLGVSGRSAIVRGRSLTLRPPCHRRRWARGRGDDTEQLAAYLDALAREVRVGTSLGAAFVEVTPSHAAAATLMPARTLVLSGTLLADALAAVHHQDRTGILVPTLVCVASIGGAAAPTLDAAASLLRDRAAVTADARAHSAQAKLSARILTVVPLGFAAWSAGFGRKGFAGSVSSPVAATATGSGLALNLLGWFWMRRITSAAEG